MTGDVKYIPPSIAKKKVSKYGSEKDFRDHYISTKAAKLLRGGLSVDEVRSQLGGTDLPSIDVHILARLKLIRKKKGVRAQEAQEKLDRAKYLNSSEFKEKMYRIKEERENMSYADWVEENTGVGKERGGTCIRPDIFLTWNNKACDGCEAYEYCLCYNKRLSHQKKKRKK